MPERLVDVSGSNRTVLHTFPITLSGSDGEVMPKDTEYEEKALRAAAHAQLVPDADLEDLTTRMHASRSGQLEPFGDDRDVLSQTKRGLDQVVRERAYLLWEMDGCPHGGADEYWHRAHDQHLRERAYVLWQQEGCPAGQADEHWPGPRNLNHTDLRSQHISQTRMENDGRTGDDWTTALASGGVVLIRLLHRLYPHTRRVGLRPVESDDRAIASAAVMPAPSEHDAGHLAVARGLKGDLS